MPYNLFHLLRRAELDDDGSVVFWTDIFVLLMLAIFTIATIPHAIGLFRSRYDWKMGYLLFRSSGVAKDDQSSASSGTTSTAVSTPRRTIPSANVLPHVRSLASRVHPVTALLRTPVVVFPGYHLGRILLLLLYFGALLFAALFRDSVFKNNVREGAIVASQLPWLYILATKNNFIGSLLGVGYERLNFIHRFLGRLITIAANLHAFGFIYKWVHAGVWTETIQEPFIRWGLVALVSIDILFLFSLSPIRQKFYNVFFATHLIALIVLLFAICFHQSFAIPYVAIAAGFYGADRILRIVKSRISHAYLTPLPELGSSLVRIPGLNRGWRAGQYVKVRVLSGSMGWWGWTEAHPYTIANSCEKLGEGEGIVLMVKKTGGWSRKVYDIATSDDMGEEETTRGEKRVRVLVEGPYGGPGYTVFASFSAAMFIAGGSGISFALATVQELLQRVARGTTNVQAVELVWIVHHPRSLTPLLELFTSLLTQSSILPLTLTIRIFYTRALTQHDEGHYPSPETLPSGMTLLPGRAPIFSLVGDFVDTTPALFAKEAEGVDIGKHGVLVGVCGPASLGEDVRQAVTLLSAAQREAVGGVELHEEAFHW